MAEFSEKIKREALRRSAYKCVYCRDDMAADVHHIIPPGEGGTEDLDNAAPLCGRCHITYGNDPNRRRKIRWARDDWWEIVSQKYSTTQIDELERLFNNYMETMYGRTKQAVKDAMKEMEATLQKTFAHYLGPAPQLKLGPSMMRSVGTALISTGSEFSPLRMAGQDFDILTQQNETAIEKTAYGPLKQLGQTSSAPVFASAQGRTASEAEQRLLEVISAKLLPGDAIEVEFKAKDDDLTDEKEG